MQKDHKHFLVRNPGIQIHLHRKRQELTDSSDLVELNCSVEQDFRTNLVSRLHRQADL